MKIILGELDKKLFPENYLYRNNHFINELNHLKNYDELDRTAILNILFIIRVTKLSCRIKSNDMRIAMSYLYSKLIDTSLDWKREFDWKEIKVVLLFFVLFSDAKNLRDLEKRIKKPITKNLIEKYYLLPKL